MYLWAEVSAEGKGRKGVFLGGEVGYRGCCVGRERRVVGSVGVKNILSVYIFMPFSS